MLADQLGFVEGYFGEHVTDAAETITSSLIFIAWLLSETKHIKLGSGTINLPEPPSGDGGRRGGDDRSHGEGRFIIGISPGGLLSDAEVFGNLDKDRTAMFVEAINHSSPSGQRAALQPERRVLDHLHRAHAYPGVGPGHHHKPFQRPHPPIVVTAVAPFSKV